MPLIPINKNNVNSANLSAQGSPGQIQTQAVGNNQLKQSLSVQSDTAGVKTYQIPTAVTDVSSTAFVQPDVLPEIPAAQLTTAENTSVQEAGPQDISELANISAMNLEQILDSAIAELASDIHLTVGYRPMLRVDGKLKTLNAKVLDQVQMIEYVKALIAKRTDIKLEEILQTDLGYTYKERRFRVNIFKMMDNLSVVARMIPEKINTFEELHLPPIIAKLSAIPSGLILFTGPTGSGKSTSLASILNNINVSRAEHIITLEDPIEFIFPKGQSLIDQREYGQDFDTWPNALRSILRQDPNVVLVGEMRDHETISSTMTVSETGHLVFATLHTNSASQTIDRIIDVFPDAQQAQIRAQLAQVIVAVVGQRLVPLPGGGRRAVHEIMVATPAVKNAIREGETHQIDNMIQTGQDYGMITLESSLVNLVKQGLISVQTAKETSNKPDELDILLSGG